MPGRFEASTAKGKTVVCVTNDGLTVDQRPDDIFSFSEAALSPWTIGNVELVQGTALHLRSGRDRFVLGGADHRVAAGTRLEAPPEDVMPDAWLSASDFDELLAMIGPRCGWDVRRPAMGERIRCLLIPNTSKGWDAADWPWQDFTRRRRNKELSALAIDVGEDAIWVIDPSTNTVIASASVTQVTATPTDYSGHSSAISEKISNVLWVIEHWERPPDGRTAVLILGIPGLQPITIACPRHWRSPQARFEWKGDVPRAHAQIPGYLVSGADWLTLAERFGLASQLNDTYGL
jgi:hypothetical protein